MYSTGREALTLAKETGLAMAGILKKLVLPKTASEEPVSDGSTTVANGLPPVEGESSSTESRVTNETSSVSAIHVSNDEKSFGKARLIRGRYFKMITSHITFNEVL